MYTRALSTLLVAAAGVMALSSAGPVHAQVRPTPVREVSPAGSQPYSTLFSIHLTSGNSINGFSPDIVPANRILVIEFVQIRAILQPLEVPMISIDDSVNDASRPFLLPMTFHGTTNSGAQEYRVTQLVKIYHEGNGMNGPGATCGREQNTFNPMDCSFTISGYLIPK